MLKYLVMLAVIFALAKTPLDTPRQGRNQQNQTIHDANKSNATSPPITQSPGQTGVIAEKPDGNPKSERTQQKPKYWKEAFGPAYAANWGLVLVGGIAGYLAWQTLRSIERQAGHMEIQTRILGESVSIAKQSADITRTQIELYVNAERARMTINVGERGRSFSVDAKNTGKAIAQVMYARGKSVLLPKGQNLPSEPSYLSEDNSGWDFVEYIEPRISIDLMREDGEYGLLADLSNPELCDAIRDDISVLWTYGRILYRDGISPVIRETRFCYKTYVMDSLEIGLCAGGEAIYRLET